MSAASAQPGPERDWSADARFHEYTSAANPPVPAVPFSAFPASLHQGGATRVVALDLATRLGSPHPATSPGLLAGFVRIVAGERLATRAVATSQLFYVMRGSGCTRCAEGTVAWSAGDLLVLPADGELEHAADADSALYWVSDAPLLAYLGVRPDAARFRATLYPRARLLAELERVRRHPEAAQRNRVGVILGNAACAQTMTVTPVLWSLLNVLPAGAVQAPHRHNSVALDLCVAAAPGTYTLIADELDDQGHLVDPRRADWQPGAMFVTPPGLWHSHHNQSGSDALVLPIQDAGLHTWLRTLDIRFAPAR